ncbi:TetR/AcrR family transcriptional regulator [uncultured Salipiger sp.]|uniref:TetR/AcrR family transcriptional regulator n=1 Tax=uncultured Salipiger sp. TaxID=499810 RepID=UPI00259291A9|nr:TetR/AcrR family transcriptional regulator [uncultured Salipiger sp.]
MSTEANTKDPGSEPAALSHRERSEATRARILEAARSQFVANGLEGTRMEAIATEAGVNKALVYRHFGSREQLYRDVLNAAYARMRESESELTLSADPIAAIEQIVCFTLSYYVENPDFLILVGIENLHQGEHLKTLDRRSLRVSDLIGRYRGIIEDGERKGVFRKGLDPVDLYTVVSAQCWYAVATSYTFGFTFDVDVLDPKTLEARKALIKRVALGYVRDLDIADG